MFNVQASHTVSQILSAADVIMEVHLQWNMLVSHLYKALLQTTNVNTSFTCNLVVIEYKWHDTNQV